MEPFTHPAASVKHTTRTTGWTAAVDTATVSSDGGCGNTDDSLLSFATPSDAASSPSVVSMRGGGGASASVAFWERARRLSSSDGPPAVPWSMPTVARNNFEDTVDANAQAFSTPGVEEVAPSLAVAVSLEHAVVDDDSSLVADGSSKTRATSASPDSQQTDEDPQLYLDGSDVGVDDDDDAYIRDRCHTPDLERMIEETMKMVHETIPPT